MNSHGDPLHVNTILKSIKNVNEKFDMNIRLFMEPYDWD
ncbi:hypothetical protein F3D3_0196 [Fusibacter sp. 3D3]|nr:hypothetical protein F3D3_0196 [Fusibacter sp. 3D3]